MCDPFLRVTCGLGLRCTWAVPEAKYLLHLLGSSARNFIIFQSWLGPERPQSLKTQNRMAARTAEAKKKTATVALRGRRATGIGRGPSFATDTGCNCTVQQLASSSEERI